MNYRTFWLTLFALLLIGTTSLAYVYQSDSVGFERKDGKILVLHKLSAGETLFSLSKQYGSTVEEIISSNQGMAIHQLAIGDTLRIPLSPQVIQPANTNVIAVHVVNKSETLYSIARKYEVDVQQIKSWNHLGNTPLSIGQKLIIYDEKPEIPESENAPPPDNTLQVHVVRQGETLYSVSKDYQVTVDQLIEWNQLQSNGISLGQKLIVSQPDQLAQPKDTSEVVQPGIDSAISPINKETQPDAPVKNTEIKEIEEKEERKEVKTIRDEEKKDHESYKKFTQTGFASPITGLTDTKKYLALHRTAPIGTIMQVRNEMSNLSVFVRVIGKLPDTGINDKLTIRITQAAYESLGGLNERIPVEISYIP